MAAKPNSAALRSVSCKGHGQRAVWAGRHELVPTDLALPFLPATTRLPVPLQSAPSLSFLSVCPPARSPCRPPPPAPTTGKWCAWSHWGPKGSSSSLANASATLLNSCCSGVRSKSACAASAVKPRESGAAASSGLPAVRHRAAAAPAPASSQLAGLAAAAAGNAVPQRARARNIGWLERPRVFKAAADHRTRESDDRAPVDNSN